MQTPERQIRRLAERQHGTVTRRQVLAAGLSDHQIARRIGSGEWRRLHQGVYLVFGDGSAQTTLAAAVAALPATVSHGSAGRLHGFAISQDRPEVTVPHRFSNRFAGVVVHESTDLDPDHVVEIQGMPVTKPARTIFDIAVRMSRYRLRRTVDEALVRRLTTITELQDLLAAIGRRGRPGTAPMRTLLASMTHSYVAPESELERRLLEMIELAGMPQPDLQAKLPWRTTVDGRVDAAYPQHQLIIECDGRRWHTLAEAFERDRRRDNLAQIAGWRVLRFTWSDLTERPTESMRLVKSAITPASS